MHVYESLFLLSIVMIAWTTIEYSLEIECNDRRVVSRKYILGVWDDNVMFTVILSFDGIQFCTNRDIEFR